MRHVPGAGLHPAADRSRWADTAACAVTEADEIESSNEPGRMVAGASELAFGALAACCVPLGCCSWLVTWFAVAPLSGVGLLCSACGRGWVRVAGRF